HAAFERAQRPMIGVHVVNSGYFHSMGIPLLRGRELAASDTTKSNPVVVINQKVAEEIYPGQDPLGRHITILGDKQLEVVGDAGNVLHNGLSEPVQFESYLPFAQRPSSYVGLAIRSQGDQAAVFSAVRNIVAGIDPELPVHDMRPMEQVVGETLATRR